MVLVHVATKGHITASQVPGLQPGAMRVSKGCAATRDILISVACAVCHLGYCQGHVCVHSPTKSGSEFMFRAPVATKGRADEQNLVSHLRSYLSPNLAESGTTLISVAGAATWSHGDVWA